MTEDLDKQNTEIIRGIKDKSDDDFEKNLLLITSGTLVLSLTFIEKIAPLDKAKWVPALVISWGLLVISLLVNLISHRKSSKYQMTYLYRQVEGKSPEETNSLIKENDSRIEKMNDWSVGLMIAGIAFLVLYCSINAFKMSEEIQRKSDPGPDTTKGRSMGPISTGNTQPIKPTEAPVKPANQPPSQPDSTPKP